MPKAAKQPQPQVRTELPIGLYINIPWNTMDVIEAQQWYAKLKLEFENAGRILNERTFQKANEASYECFMAGKPLCCKKGVKHMGIPRGLDNSYKDPETGLYKPVRVCSENCWIRYQDQRVRERREQYLKEANG
jgi:hypothetical protein